MENKIELISRHGLKMDVGKLTTGKTWSNEKSGRYVNVTTYFEPLGHVILMLEIKDSPSVHYLSNVAYYGDSLGGFSAKLKESASYDDFLSDLTSRIKELDARMDLEATQHPSSDEQE